MREDFIKKSPIYIHNVDSEITKEFFETVQNKLHYSIAGQTVAEIIYNRADANKKYMGLTN